MINTLSAYAGGNFTRSIKISPRYDELDAISESINMVGQELKAVTISRNYFNNIFHSVSDMIFVLDKSGKIMDTNKRVYDHLGYQKESLLDKKLDALLDPEKDHFTKDILRGLRQRDGKIYSDYYFKTAGGTLLPVRVSASYLIDNTRKKSGILLIAQDRTSQIENENRVIRAIIDTQEEERRRLARDLHDSLGQELIGVKFAVSTLSEECKNKREKKVLQQSDGALDQIIRDMRDICFNLIPKALEDFGLLEAVRELCLDTELTHRITFEIKADDSFPELPRQVEIDLYRVIQEFINNAIRHGQSSYISMCFKNDKDNIFISLQDNGSGFSTNKVAKGMGLQNIESRIRSHKGEMILESSYGKGTRFQIVLPDQVNYDPYEKATAKPGFTGTHR
jgi:PAS domain S-box-containing protein